MSKFVGRALTLEGCLRVLRNIKDVKVGSTKVTLYENARIGNKVWGRLDYLRTRQGYWIDDRRK